MRKIRVNVSWNILMLFVVFENIIKLMSMHYSINKWQIDKLKRGTYKEKWVTKLNRKLITWYLKL